MVNHQLGVRLTDEQYAAIDKLIESGEFGNRSEVVQYAVRKFLKEVKEGWKRLPPPPLIKRPCGRQPKSGVSKSAGAS